MKTFPELVQLLEELGVHPELGKTGKGWNVEQNPNELAKFLVRMQELGVKSVLEIGTGYRAGLARFLYEHMHWTVTTYDVHNYRHNFPGITFLIGDNPDFKKADLVFIDANHAYESVKADYNKYKDYANKVIAFHDIDGLRGCEGVQRFWFELSHTRNNKRRKGYYELVDGGTKRSGIGWIEL